MILKLKQKSRFAVFNIKTKRFADYDGSESRDCYTSWPDTDGPQEVLDEIKYYIDTNKKYKNKIIKNRVKKMSRHSKYLKIVEITHLLKTL